MQEGFRLPADSIRSERRLRLFLAQGRSLPIVFSPLLALAFAALCAGCSNKLVAPPLSPERAAADALTEYDTNKDGFLDAKELERCPALKSALNSLDTDKDKRLSASEITERLASYKKSGVALTSTTCNPCRSSL